MIYILFIKVYMEQLYVFFDRSNQTVTDLARYKK